MASKIYPINEKFSLDKPVSEKVIATDNLVIVYFYLKKGQKIPLHASKSEVFVTVLQGKGKFYYGSEESSEMLERGESLYYLPEEPHGFEAVEDMIVQAIVTPNPQKKIKL